MATETKKILHIVDADLANLGATQIGVQQNVDVDLAYRMWGGKDASGNLTQWLAKGKPGSLTTLKLTGGTTTSVAGILKHDASGNITGQAELNLISDVDAPSPSDGESLVYSSTSGKWEPTAVDAGLLEFKGTWDASTNTPTLGSGGTGGVSGDVYIVSVAGSTTIDGESDWKIKDWIANNGSAWYKVDNTESVVSVNGDTGAVSVTLNSCYDEESGTHTVTVDDGDISFDLTGAYSVVIDLAAATGSADGFIVTNGADQFSLLYGGAADRIELDADLREVNISSWGPMVLETTYYEGSDIDIQATGNIDIDGDAITVDATENSNFTVATGNLSLTTTGTGDVIITAAEDVDIDAGNNITLDTASISLAATDASNFTVTGLTNDLTLGARDATITLNESGDTTLSGYTATSIIGALNEVKGEVVTAGTGLTKSGTDIRVGDGSTGDINGINRAAGDISAAVDDSTVEISANLIQVKNLGITTGKLAATCVTAAKLGSDVAGDGLTGGNGSDLDVQADTTGGANLAEAINVSANGVAVKVDASTIDGNGSDQLYIPNGGVTETQLNTSVAGTGITGGGGSALALDITGLTNETSPASGDSVAIYDATAAALREMTLANLLKILYLEVPSSDGGYSGFTETVTVDANATGVGAALYEASDGHYEEADADASTTMPCTALALESGTGSKLVLRYGYLYRTAWSWTKSGGFADALFISTTTGALTKTSPTGAGDQIQIAGWVHSANVVYFVGGMCDTLIEYSA